MIVQFANPANSLGNYPESRSIRMQNIKCVVKNDRLLITIDLTKKGKASASGKTMVVASTRGNQAIEGTDVILGLNLYKFPTAK